LNATQYTLHVHEYTKSEVEKVLIDHGFKIVKSFYTEVSDLSFINVTPELTKATVSQDFSKPLTDIFSFTLTLKPMRA